MAPGLHVYLWKRPRSAGDEENGYLVPQLKRQSRGHPLSPEPGRDACDSEGIVNKYEPSQELQLLILLTVAVNHHLKMAAPVAQASVDLLRDGQAQGLVAPIQQAELQPTPFRPEIRFRARLLPLAPTPNADWPSANQRLVYILHVQATFSSFLAFKSAAPLSVSTPLAHAGDQSETPAAAGRRRELINMQVSIQWQGVFTLPSRREVRSCTGRETAARRSEPRSSQAGSRSPTASID
ncbi:unnamed protein product [Tetraodon nigroviridis]|uniref:(spotted green pufferfish) hypothetical protein n=1 Tax=Tetraodon nigroviridis TaxID=99883 RepID=Q4SGK7_TETNG|nr:unnamed protein product [Tetraodon nigroviridis]